MIKLNIHPLANIIPLMLTDEAVDLERDIEANGQRQPITIYNGMILDGRHRYAVCLKLGIEPKTETFTGTEDEAKALVLSLNIHRRHLTFDQKQAIIDAELKRDPTQSDRTIAAKAKASPTTVGKSRAKGEAAGQLSTVDSSTGADGKTRKRTAKKVKVSKPAVVAPALSKSVAVIANDKPEPPSNGAKYAKLALDYLNQITDDDVQRGEALALIKGWCDSFRILLGDDHDPTDRQEVLP